MLELQWYYGVEGRKHTMMFEHLRVSEEMIFQK